MRHYADFLGLLSRDRPNHQRADTMAETDRTQRDKVDLQTKLAILVRNTHRSFLEFGGLLEAEQQKAGELILSDGEAGAEPKSLGKSEWPSMRLSGWADSLRRR